MPGFGFARIEGKLNEPYPRTMVTSPSRFLIIKNAPGPYPKGNVYSSPVLSNATYGFNMNYGFR